MPICTNDPNTCQVEFCGWPNKCENEVAVPIVQETEDELTPEIKEKTVSEMTRKEIEATPEVEDWKEDIGLFDSLVILPAKRLHDSGYRCMYFIACIRGVPKYKLAGGSDVLHIDGIGGYGKDWLKKYGTCPALVEPTAWNIDCLPKSGLLQLFTHGKLSTSPALSSFEIYTEKETKL
jgi:hypothetical protein